ncbi:MAG: NACHT domain-containing protein, partial [Leptolyngbyaceae bacterium]|nr:NACHT domain-containing protein [Leptolyngbyaceae bacterium]
MSTGQTGVFLIRFNEENKGRRDSDVKKLVEAQLSLDAEAYKKRKTEIYAKFEWGKQNPDGCQTLENAGPQKHKRLLEWLEDKYEDFSATQVVTELQTTFDWASACQTKLENQVEDRLLRRKATEYGFEVDVHVGLGLVERKRQQRRNQTDRTSLYELTDPSAKGKSYGHQQFLSEVIGQPPTGKNKHIAIVGEPGAGKTTLLVAIAQHLINQKSKPEALPIFIPLAGLQGKPLKEYILEEWLPDTVRLVDPTANIAELQESFQQWLYQHPIWLLLDAVDEMGETLPAKALSGIQSQLTDGLGQVRVALTCRLNVWDASLSNPLVGFDTYKTQEFEPDQIQEFICRWFEQA